MMDLDELQSVQSRERQTDSLQQLRESFYRDAGEFIQQLREERERAAEGAEDPWNDPEINRLSDDIDTAEDTVEAIYERRVGKIVKMASLAAANMPTEDEGLTDEERALFETLVSAIESNREHVVALLEGDDPDGITSVDAGAARPTDANASRSPDSDETRSADSDETRSADADSSGVADEARSDAAESLPDPDADSADSRSSTSDPRDGVDAAGLMGGDGPEEDGTDDSPASERDGEGGFDGKGESDGEPTRSDDSERGETDREPSESDRDRRGSDRDATDGGTDVAADVDRETVRITVDVGEIYGVDQRAYDLTAEDVVRLPAANAEPLVERDAAERLE